MSGERRMDRQPALFLIADAICSLGDTDGFCTPRHGDACKCWTKAEQMQNATGLSANACVWVLQHRTKIEQQANGDRS